MARLIDADKAIENIMIRQYALKDRTGNVDSGLFTRDIERCIKGQPTLSPVDVRPMVRGHWLDYDNTERFTARCSICRNFIDTRFGTNFCPKCGADMREVDNGKD